MHAMRNAATKDTSVTIRIESVLLRKLERIARRDDRSIGWIVRRAVEEYVKREQ